MITLKTLHSATAQQVYDQIKAHALKQNAQCLDSSGGCLYRNKNDMACFGGCLMSDKEYDPKFEGKVWFELIRDYKISDNNQLLIERLQSIHDDIDPLYWESDLENVAKEFNLIP